MVKYSKILVDTNGYPRDPVSGIETEFGLICHTENGHNTNEALSRFGFYALKMDGRQQMKRDGSRRYMDNSDMTPELSTAEDISFSGSARRTVAGYVAMAECFRQAIEPYNERQSGYREGYQLPISKVELMVDTSDPWGNSRGSHGNLLVPRALKLHEIFPALAVHRLSRIIWSGAGFVKQKGESGFQYCLSEKAEHVFDVVNSQTTNFRPLVNTKDEPLADPRYFRRIHDSIGENVLNPFVIALRLASESIILKAVALGVNFDDLMPENPVKAIREISHDTTLKTKVRLENGTEMSGIDLQEAIANRSIQAALKAEVLTEQEKEWAQKWQSLINDLKIDPRLCIKRVNWYVKQELIDRHLAATSGKAGSDYDKAWQKAVDFHRLLPFEGKGMQLLRHGFFEDSLSEDVLDNGLPLPPTRAKMRGDAIGRLLETEVFYFSADWETVLCVEDDENEGRKFKMRDPFVTENPALEEYLTQIAA